MRSEKEIREMIPCVVDVKTFDLERLILWVLEGEPRYSVAELEKIIHKMMEDDDQWFNGYKLINLIKDKKKMDVILNGK